MTTYNAATTGSGGNLSLGVKAGTLPVRFVKIEISLFGNGAASFAAVAVTKYNGLTLTGGSTVTPLAFREGAPAATATAKSGATASGTAVVLHQEYDTVTTDTGSNPSYQFPFDLIAAPGSGLAVAITPSIAGGLNSSIIEIGLYFEELQLSFSY